MEMFSAAHKTHRSRSFYFAGFLALFLSVVSWVNPVLVNFLNVQLFHKMGWADRGATLYVAMRLPLAALLVWTIWRFPVRTSHADSGSASLKDTRFFDPLMGLRALACAIVLMGHYFLVVFPFGPGVSLVPRVLLRAPPWAGVWIFFTLSGYLMGKGFARGRYSLDAEGARLFFRNRLLRIYPIYAIAVLLLSLLFYRNILQPPHLWMLVENLIFDCRGDLAINPDGALWSVSTEVQFYLLVPLLAVALMALARRMGRAFVGFPVLLLAIFTAARVWMAVYRPNDVGIYVYAPLMGNLDLFVAGMSVNLLPRGKRPEAAMQRRLRPLLLAAGVGIYAIVCAGFALDRLRFTLQEFWAVGPMVCALLAAGFIYVAEWTGKIAVGARLSGRLLLGIQGVGTLTYCLYVFHPEIYIRNAARLPAIHGVGVSLEHFPWVMLQLFAVASFFYLAVEKPFDRKKKVSGTALLDAP